MSNIIINESRRVRAIDFEQEWFKDIVIELGEEFKIHRKLWEFCVISQVYLERVGVNGKVLGFGVGKEPLPAFFANHAAKVIATDLPSPDSKWLDTSQQSLSLEDLPYEGICNEQTFHNQVKFLPVDMNDIPSDLLQGEFDLTWSCGSFEHIGGISKSIDFFCRQMSALKPGGVAVHTTEFNFQNNITTISNRDLVLFRLQDLQELERRLNAQGDTLLTLDLEKGTDPADLYIDYPPYEQTDYHLNIGIGDHVSTSIVLIAIRGDGKTNTKVEVEVEDNNKNDNPTILWVGDAVVASGFAACTHVVCDHLHSKGWNVHVLGLNYFGDPHSYPYPIYPCRNPFENGYDGFGIGRLPHLVESIKPDVIVLLNDPWNIPAYMEAIENCSVKPKVVGWLAVDGENQKGSLLNTLDHVIVWTKFANIELRRGGCTVDISVVPLGVDTSIFHPIDKAEARSKVCPANLSDAFIVGSVGRNQPRKRVDLTLEYFAEWLRQYDHDNTYLFLHVAPTGDRGVDIPSLVKYYGLNGKVLLSSPHIGHGDDQSLMPLIYSSFDVYLTTTQGEGWGLTIHEAMACGIPCIVPDWSGLGRGTGWTGDASYTVPCTSRAMNAPLNSLTYTIGGIPDKQLTIQALQDFYSLDKELKRKYSERGQAQANLYTWQNTANRFHETLIDKVLV